jgi:hypothetical protein
MLAWNRSLVRSIHVSLMPTIRLKHRSLFDLKKTLERSDDMDRVTKASHTNMLQYMSQRLLRQCWCQLLLLGRTAALLVFVISTNTSLTPLRSSAGLHRHSTAQQHSTGSIA